VHTILPKSKTKISFWSDSSICWFCLSQLHKYLSIHPFSSAYPRSGHWGNRSRVYILQLLSQSLPRALGLPWGFDSSWMCPKMCPKTSANSFWCKGAEAVLRVTPRCLSFWPHLSAQLTLRLFISGSYLPLLLNEIPSALRKNLDLQCCTWLK